MKNIIEEYGGWNIALPCPKCKDLDCNGSFIAWFPNVEHNENELHEVDMEEALNEGMKLQKLLNRHCDRKKKDDVVVCSQV